MKIDISKLNPRDFEEKPLHQDSFVFSGPIGPETILAWFESEDAHWQYDGKPSPLKPHAELTSGMHSDGFFDCLRVLRYPNIAEILAKELVLELERRLENNPELRQSLKEQEFGDVTESWVVSSAYAAITFGHEVAKALGAKFMFLEKDPNDPKGKKMLWQRMTIPRGAAVFQVEELITTSKTFKEVRRAVEAGNSERVKFFPIVLALVHRPEKLPIKYDGIEVVALIEAEVHQYRPDPKNCPYCKVGSKALRPKTHWRKLTGKD